MERTSRVPQQINTPLVSSSPAPRLYEEGQPKNAGRSPCDCLCVAVPDVGWDTEDEAVEMMIYWGSWTAPTSLILPLRIQIKDCFHWFVCEITVQFQVISLSIYLAQRGQSQPRF